MENFDFLHADEERQEPPDSEDEGDGPVHAKRVDAASRRSIHRERTARLRAALKAGLSESDSENREGAEDKLVLSEVLSVLQFLSTTRINLAIFLDALLWGSPACISNATCRYARTTLMQSECFPSILERCHTPPSQSSGAAPEAGRPVLEKFAIDCVECLVDDEMEASARFFRSPREDMTAEKLLSINFGALKEQVRETAPTLWGLLRTAAYTPEQSRRNKHKNPDMVVLHMVSQAQYTRSNRRAKIPKLWSIYLKACGVPARAFDALHAVGLAMSHKWTIEALKALSNEALEALRHLIHLFPWVISHDNINIAMKVFSQRLDNQSSFISGCAFTVYILPGTKLPPNANRELQIFRARNSDKVFAYDDVLYGDAAADAQFRTLDAHYILRLLIGSPAFSSYPHLDNALFRTPAGTHRVRNVVKMLLLETRPLEEASYEGTLNVIVDAFKQLGLATTEEEMKTAVERLIPWIGDQLTVERLRGLWRFRHEDDNSFDRLDFMVPVFGWFHLVMAFANSLHRQYLCNSATTGSLRHAFDLLTRKGLVKASTKGPFWHHLDEALHHIAEAHLRACWLEVGGVNSLEELMSRSPEELMALAADIVRRHASRAAVNDEDLGRADQKDEVFREWSLFITDVLPYIHLRRAIRSGDVGLMENLLPTLLFRFAGGGNPKYTIEVLELLQGLKQEWPPFLCEHIREFCWVMSAKDDPNTHLPFDLAQEHNIADIKVNFRTHSPNTTFDYIGSTSPAIPTLRQIQRHMESEFQTNKRGSRHGTPDKEADVAKLTQHYYEARLHRRIAGRKHKHTHVDDYTTDGSAALEGSTIPDWFQRRSLKRSTAEDWTELILPENLQTRGREAMQAMEVD